MHIDPLFTMFAVSVFMLSLTVGTIIHVYMIDLKFAKQRYKKGYVAHVLIWLSLAGAVLNAPVWWMIYQSLQ